VPFIRAIGRWTMTALVINCIIGSGIFGVPAELTHLLGRASPLAMLAAGLVMAVILGCMAEVASQFSEPGGPYLYVRTAFGRFAGLQVAWFSLLAFTVAPAATTSLFLTYLAGLLPWAGHGWARLFMLSVFLLVPTLANCYGVRNGATISNLLTVAKLLPLLLLIALGLLRFLQHFKLIHAREITSPGIAAWLSALLLLIFAYGGSEGAVIPVGEVKDPRRTVPFGLFAGLAAATAVYVLVQFVTVATIGASSSGHPLADTASVLVGAGGATFVAIAVMISTYGRISSTILNNPRLLSSLASQGDMPMFLGKLHARFNTPTTAIVLYAATLWILAASGTFLWFAELAAASMIVIYGSTCAALIGLRRQRPQADALRLPFGRAFAVAGVLISLALLTQLEARQALFMVITTFIAIANWWWARRRAPQAEPAVVRATALR
jgi:APA family basic amino acid/polyamine antiporter